jgi:hypothetical protein
MMHGDTAICNPGYGHKSYGKIRVSLTHITNGFLRRTPATCQLIRKYKGRTLKEPVYIGSLESGMQGQPVIYCQEIGIDSICTNTVQCRTLSVVHNIYSKSLNNQFNLGAMSAGMGKEIKLTSAGPVIIRCNMHKDMIGTIFVVPNGYYAQVDEQGKFSFSDVNSTEYIMQFWHPQLYPEEVLSHAREVSLTGEDKTLEIKVVSQSKVGEIHDLVDDTDYKQIVDSIEKEINQAITDWKNKKKFISRKRMLIAITRHYEGEGLKGAIAKSFSVNRSEKLEQSLDSIRKKISGINKSTEVTEDNLRTQAGRVVAQLRNNVKELEYRLNPGKKKAGQ